jgi:hypothetical protein
VLDFELTYVYPESGRTLVVGSKVFPGRTDRRLMYKDVVGLDMEAGDGVDLVHNLEIAAPASLGKFRHVDCISVLEHSKQPWLVAQNIEKVMKSGATLFLSVPFIWRFHGYPNDYFRFTAEGVKVLFKNIEWDALMYGSTKLSDDSRIEGEKIDGHPYFPRTEVLGFGRRV